MNILFPTVQATVVNDHFFDYLRKEVVDQVQGAELKRGPIKQPERSLQVRIFFSCFLCDGSVQRKRETLKSV